MCGRAYSPRSKVLCDLVECAFLGRQTTLRQSTSGLAI